MAHIPRWLRVSQWKLFNALSNDPVFNNDQYHTLIFNMSMDAQRFLIYTRHFQWRNTFQLIKGLQLNLQVYAQKEKVTCRASYQLRVGWSRVTGTDLSVISKSKPFPFYLLFSHHFPLAILNSHCFKLLSVSPETLK